MSTNGTAGLGFARTLFGDRSTNLPGGVSTSRKDLPKAQLWMNIGYVMAVTVTLADGTSEDREEFVSLPVGIPLDTQEPKAITGTSDIYRKRVAAQNKLLEDAQKLGAELKPGEDAIIGDRTGLCIQIRRISEEQAAPSVDESENPFVRNDIFASK